MYLLRTKDNVDCMPWPSLENSIISGREQPFSKAAQSILQLSDNNQQLEIALCELVD